MENVSMNVNVKKEDTISGLLDVFLIPVIFMWTMPGLATVIPVLTALTAFGYWQWVGTMIVVRYLARIINRAIRR